MSHPTTPVSRSSVVRGMAWSVPAVAAVAAAPLAAASPNVVYTVDFVAGRATTTGATGAPVIAAGIASSPAGGLTKSPLQLTVTGARTVTITFDRAVSDVTFTLADLDWVNNNGSNGVKDTVSVSPAPTKTSPSGATATSPFSATAGGTVGSVAVTIAGPVTAITLALSSTQGKTTPDVLVQNMRFTYDLKTR